MPGKRYTKHCGIPVHPETWEGLQFGRLTALGHPFKIGNQSFVVFECVCGKILVCSGPAVKDRDGGSCGCLKSELIKERSLTHGMTETPEYKIWTGILTRCRNPNSRSYVRYGGRGITICERWATSFSNFYEDMGNRPSKQHSIERIDNNRGYSADNCKWATAAEQSVNKSSSRILEFCGIRKTVTEWSRVSKVPLNTILNRLNAGCHPTVAVWLSRRKTATGLLIK
jgi:hypothetical protein